MPELPEVENVKLSLENQGLAGQMFKNVEFRRPNLRTKLRPELRAQLPGQTIHRLERRAKFLLLHTEDYTVVSHLGMTGSWRFTDDPTDLEKHDHVVLYFASGKTLVFNDPRRFGVFELVRRNEMPACHWLTHLGPEPLSTEFTAEFLFARTRKRKSSIKALLMDQRQVVGVGNIYASEALFAARVKPTRPAGRVTKVECERIVEGIRKILNQAIKAGGSTIRDYRNSNGESGQFQDRFAVYDQAGKPCGICGETIKSAVLAGRSTYWCKSCQR